MDHMSNETKRHRYYAGADFMSKVRRLSLPLIILGYLGALIFLWATFGGYLSKGNNPAETSLNTGNISYLTISLVVTAIGYGLRRHLLPSAVFLLLLFVIHVFWA